VRRLMRSIRAIDACGRDGFTMAALSGASAWSHPNAADTEEMKLGRGADQADSLRSGARTWRLKTLSGNHAIFKIGATDNAGRTLKTQALR
jgi:hypothetical protein